MGGKGGHLKHNYTTDENHPAYNIPPVVVVVVVVGKWLLCARWYPLPDLRNGDILRHKEEQVYTKTNGWIPKMTSAEVTPNCGLQ